MKRLLRFVLVLSIVCSMACSVMVSASEVSSNSVKLSTLKISTPSISTISRKGKGKATVKWNKISGVDGYQIQYANDNKYTMSKTVTVLKDSTTSRAIGSLSNSKDTIFRIRAYKTVNGIKLYSKWSASVKVIVWKKSWKYAKNSKIHSDHPILYYASGSKKKNITVAINAGHGCKGGSSKKTLCHPDGSAKVTGGSTGAGAKYATSINEGTTLKKGVSEASTNLKIAKKAKTKLLKEGYNVLMIREDSNTQLDNIARTVVANKYAKCHIAIHFDSTSSNKGAFFISVPNVKSYRSMEPVKSHWKQHNALGSKLISGLKAAKVKIFSNGKIALDLTQTSYSTIPSIDLELGDQGTSLTDKNLNKMVTGIVKGVNSYFK